MWKTKAVPAKFEQYSDSWTTFMPDLQRKFYTDTDLDAVVRESTPQFYSQWSNFSRPIEKADFARYVLLYAEGGIYADLDVELLRPMYDLCACGNALLPMELLWELPPRQSYFKKRQRHTRLFLGQSVMISPKGWEVRT
jgi:mannosyltransferase OCH1-like enzyme